MNFTQFLAVLRARWWVLVLVAGVTVAVTLVVSLMLPKQYTATVSVVVDFKPDPVSAMIGSMQVSPAVMATQVDIIQSDRVANRVVRNLKLAENPAVQAQWREATGGQGTIEQWLAQSMRKAVDVQPSRESSVITIAYRAPDPRFAAGAANAFMDAYLQTVLELRTDPARSYSGFFDTRTKEARDQLERAQSRLSAFQQQNGIIATDERLDVENARLNDLSSQLVVLQALSAESGSRQAQAAAGQGERMNEVLNNALISQLKADIGRTEARLRELGVRYGDAHPQVQETRASLAELRTRLDAEIRRVSGGVGVTDTINRAREAQVRADLEAQRAKVLKMKAVRDEGLVIQREVENAQKAYDVIVGRYNQTTLESQTTQSNINVLSRAEPPLEPSSPRVVLNTLLAVFVGTLLAIGTVMLLEMLDRRVRTVDDIAQALGVPVLGVLPRPGARLLGGRRPSPFQQRLMAPLPQNTKG